MCSRAAGSGSFSRICRRPVQPGVLTGSPITDLRITLVSGKAHLKHTEGGDFRQATYRAVRQGLRKAQSVLLEPWYAFRLEAAGGHAAGRAMTDLERMHAGALRAGADGEAKAVHHRRRTGPAAARMHGGGHGLYERAGADLLSAGRATARAREQDEIVKQNRLRPGARSSASDGLRLLQRTARALRSSGTRSTGWRICRCWISAPKKEAEAPQTNRPLGRARAARRSWKRSCWRSSSGRMGRSSGATCFP